MPTPRSTSTLLFKESRLMSRSLRRPQPQLLTGVLPLHQLRPSEWPRPLYDNSELGNPPPSRQTTYVWPHGGSTTDP